MSTIASLCKSTLKSCGHEMQLEYRKKRKRDAAKIDERQVRMARANACRHYKAWEHVSGQKMGHDQFFLGAAEA